MNKKVKRIRYSTLIAVLLLVLAVVWVIVRIFSDDMVIDGATNEKRIAFIQSYGWQTEPIPDCVEEIRIPARFDAALEQYNALQKQQGFNLKKHCAAYATKFTYRITNYGGQNPLVPINANLIVVNGEIVAADISSAEANGFIAVLVK